MFSDWSSITIDNFRARMKCLMVTLSPNLVMIYGGAAGFINFDEKLSDGVIFNTDE